MNKLIYLIAFLGITSVGLQAQTVSIIGRPKIFEKPIDYFASAGQMAEIYKNEAEKSTENSWAVISDREENPVFDRPNGRQSGLLGFLEMYYVVAEQGEWIKIATGRANGLVLSAAKELGWVHKSKMLIWTAGLVNQRTGINEKVFLLNKADDINQIIQLERKDIVKLFKGPSSTSRTDDLFIYSFFFVYKKENNRYLIGREYITNNYNYKNTIVGWVGAERCADWNTRICVEPNFTKIAFEERTQNPNLRLIAYKDRGGAKLHANSGIITQNQIYFDQDPAVKQGAVTAKTNPYRYPGSIVRYPMLSSNEGTSDFFRTGVIGEIKVKESNGSIDFISSQDWAKMFEKYKLENKKFENYDVLFVIEGTEQMNEFKTAFIKGIEQVVNELATVKNARIGVMVYRDPINASTGRYVELKKMTPVSNAQEVINWLKNIPFSNFGEQDPYTGLYFGLNKAVTEADLTELHTNIIFIVGNNGDFKADGIRKAAAEDKNDPTLLDASTVVDNLLHLNAHVYVLQCKNNDDNPSHYFTKQAHYFMIENSKGQYNTFSELKKYYPDMGMAEPFLPKMESSDRLELIRSAIPGVLLKPASGNALSAAQIVEFMRSGIQKSASHLEQTNQELVAIIEKGDNLDRNPAAGGFSPGILPFLNEIIQKSGMSGDAARNLTDYKYQLYAEVFIPKQIKKAQHPTCSYVLFMPENDLKDHIRLLEQFITLVGDGDYYDKRQRLHEAMQEMAERFSGEGNLEPFENRSLRFNNFLGLVHGIKAEGLVLVDPVQDFLLSDIVRETTMSNEQLDSFVGRIIEKKDKLKKIFRQGKMYEFAYTTGEEVYFWIPVEDSF